MTEAVPEEVPTQWQQRPEAGGRLGQWMLRTLAFKVGRPVARFITFFVALYFMIRRGPERAASKLYLERILGRRPSPLEIYWHFLSFSTVTLDRLYLMADRFARFDVRTFGLDQLDASIAGGRGTLLLSAHLGSFDALRVLSTRSPDVPIRILLDVGQNAGLSMLLNSLNPTLASTIIDARRPGPALVLEMQQALEQNAVVSTLADRLRQGNPSVTADFLGTQATFPASPWLFAGALQVPVVLAFGLYRGGKRYDLHFESFPFHMPRDRRERKAALAEVVQRFASRLEHFARLAPYNWFNLYDFWDASLATNDPPVRTADTEPGAGPQPRGT
jgi:predicted LPLAT superfamily acyltransferase